MWVRASTEPAANGSRSAWPSTSSIRAARPASSTRRAPPASISGLWSIPTTRHGYRRASAIATAAVPVATSATRASGRDAAGATCSTMRSCQRRSWPNGQELRPAVVVAGDAREEPAGVHLSVGGRPSPAVRSHTCPRPPLALAVLGRGVVDPVPAAASRRRRGGSARAGGLRDRCASMPGCRFASTCTSAPRRVGARARAPTAGHRGARRARRRGAGLARRARRRLRVVLDAGRGRRRVDRLRARDAASGRLRRDARPRNRAGVASARDRRGDPKRGALAPARG